MLKKSHKVILLLLFGVGGLLLTATALSLRPVDSGLFQTGQATHTLSMTDRHGTPLFISYQGRWNNQIKPLHAMPDLLKTAFITSEDQYFFDHHGVDIRAKIAALYQNLQQRKTIRGASTITEQIVRMVNPRPRTVWSKWLEGIEAVMLDHTISKPALFEFYLNQLPYAAERRGVVQAARYYFNRDLETLNAPEILSLVILARAPSAYDLYKNPAAITGPMQRLAARMEQIGDLSPAQIEQIHDFTPQLEKPSLPIEARHFARFARLHTTDQSLRTTLDGTLQGQIQNLLDQRLRKLHARAVHNAGAIVIDHQTNDILAWVVGGATNDQTPARDIDPILTPRQPGSTLKPFLYSMALENGWTAATLINDAPVADAIGAGLHRFRNYSLTHYGPITLREALGNSLNIPAILTIRSVGVDPFLDTLHDLGFSSLRSDSSYYDEGLALGNGEVTLFELARAYSVLARHGKTAALRMVFDHDIMAKSKNIFDDEAASLITNILADPSARALEFGRDSVLNLPHRTAIKTGTSTDYKDAWSVGYNDRYTVAIWMGNLNRTPMMDVTGSSGPALVLRAIFNLLNAKKEPQNLYLSPSLISRDVCTRPMTDESLCTPRTEYFLSTGPMPDELHETTQSKKIELVRPTEGLSIAYDPRIPKNHQKFRFEVANAPDGAMLRWVLNGQTLKEGYATYALWPVTKGHHTLDVLIETDDYPTIKMHKKASFFVK